MQPIGLNDGKAALSLLLMLFKIDNIIKNNMAILKVHSFFEMLLRHLQFAKLA